jgi:biopolymer transport protein TolR
MSSTPQLFGGGDDDADSAMISGINVTPLVDITLVLLIIFMVTASVIVNAGIKVELPKAASGTDQAKTTLAVTLQKDGSMYLNGAKANDQAVVRFIGENLPGTPDLQAVIAADRSVPHGDVVHVIDLVKRAGIRKFAINVDPNTAPAGR